MTTRELIAELQKMDPSGETQVCVGNHAIWYLDDVQFYYDGTLQMLELYDNGRPKSARFASDGRKIRIRTLSIENAIWDNPDMPVAGGGEYEQESVRKWRIERLADDEESNPVEKRKFVGYVIKDYGESLVLKLWDDSDESIVMIKDFDKQFLLAKGVKAVGDVIEATVINGQGMSNVVIDIKYIGSSHGKYKFSITNIEPSEGC